MASWRLKKCMKKFPPEPVPVQVKVFRFTRFEREVVGLSFKYDADLVDLVKRLLWEARVQITPDFQQGGWVPDQKCWYVEPGAWLLIGPRLRELGYVLVGEEAPVE